MSLTRRIRNAYAALTGRSHEMAGGGARMRQVGQQHNVAHAILTDGRTMRARARYADANNATIRACNDAIVAGTVGDGAKVRSNVSDPTLAARLSAGYEAAAERFNQDYRIGNCATQTAFMKGVVRDGEALAIVGTDADLRLKIMMLDPEQVDASLTRQIAPDHVIVNGVEFYRGCPVAYHVIEAPIASPLLSYSPRTKRIPADDVIHALRIEAPQQVRGRPACAPVFLMAQERDAFIDALAVNLKISAMNVAFVTNQNGELGSFAGEVAEGGNGVADLGMSPGEIRTLAPGEDVKFNAATPVAAGVNEFIAMSVREIAAAMGVPAYIVSGDLRDGNYSSLRAATIEFRRRLEGWQEAILINQIIRPLYRRWLTLEVISGRIAIPDFFQRPETYFDTTVIAARSEGLDPIKDTKAEIAAINAGLTSRRAAVAGRGFDVEQIDADNAADRAREKRLGLGFTSEAA